MADPRYFPTERDIVTNGTGQAALHERAAEVTRGKFGKEVFVRAVVEVSNYCRENCAYCGMRRDNRALHRFRAGYEQLAELLIHHCPDTVTDVNIQAGEDPIAVHEVVLPLIQALRRETAHGISVCLGTLDRELYAALRAAGATIYIMKFELGDEANYEKFEAPGTFDERLQNIHALAADGWNVSSGFIVGLPGHQPQELMASFRLANELPICGCSVSPFIPGGDTPLANFPPVNANWTLNSMAALRLMRPDWVIPAVSALNLTEKDGYRHGLRAGANLVTMNLTPTNLREDYIIYKRERFIMTEERVLEAIAAEGLTPSRQGLSDYYQQGAGCAQPAAARQA